MQEDIENRSIALAIKSTKLTTQILKIAILKYLQSRKEKHYKIPHGKQSIKKLARQNQGMSNIQVNDKNIKSFERIAKKYGVDFAIKKDKSTIPPKYLVFFKGKDADAINSAFTEFTAKNFNKSQKPSVISQLRKFIQLVRNSSHNVVKNKNKEQSL